MPRRLRRFSWLVRKRRATPGAARSVPTAPATPAWTPAAARPPPKHGLRRPRYPRARRRVAAFGPLRLRPPVPRHLFLSHARGLEAPGGCSAPAGIALSTGSPAPSPRPRVLGFVTPGSSHSAPARLLPGGPPSVPAQGPRGHPIRPWMRAEVPCAAPGEGRGGEATPSSRWAQRPLGGNAARSPAYCRAVWRGKGAVSQGHTQHTRPVSGTDIPD